VEKNGARVRMIACTPEALQVIWLAYKACYYGGDPSDLWDARPGDKEAAEFIRRYLWTSHATPRTHAHFTFTVSGVSRACVDQVRTHHVGVSFDVQSQRFVRYGDDLRVVVPPKVRDLGRAPTDSKEAVAWGLFLKAEDAVRRAYDALLQAGVPGEDARFILPMGTESAFIMTANFQALLHIGDERLCTAAQWEVRRMFARVRAEVRRAYPDLATAIQPKCGDHRQGYCNEPLRTYDACPLSRVRPHRAEMVASYGAITEEDLEAVGRL
jgi:thymidylate synthase (FAD)